MNLIRYNHWAISVIICLLLPVTGCTLASYNTHPEYSDRVNAVQNPVILMSEVYLYQMAPDGTATRRDDWSAVGRQNLRDAILQSFNARYSGIQPLDAGIRTSPEVKEVNSLYKLVHKTMDQQIFGPSRTNIKKDDFQYSLGSLETILGKLNADAAIFITGYDKVSSAGRKSMVDLAIADSSGTILYYSVKGTMNGRDLRDPVSARAMAKDLLAGFSKSEG